MFQAADCDHYCGYTQEKLVRIQILMNVVTGEVDVGIGAVHPHEFSVTHKLSVFRASAASPSDMKSSDIRFSEGL